MIARESRSGQAIVLGLLCLMLALLVGTQSSCGGNHKQTTLRVSVISLNTARDAFMRWDTERQVHIVEISPTREVYEARVAAHRAKRDRALVAFGEAYKRLANAYAGDDDKEIADATRQVAQLADAVKALEPTAEGPPDTVLNLFVEPCANGSTDPCPSLPPLVPSTADAGVSP